MLFAMLILTGFNLWNSMNKQQAATPSADLLTTLRKQNRDLMDVSAMHTLQAYNRSLDDQLNQAKGKLDEQVKQKQLNEASAKQQKQTLDDETQEKKIRGMILVADTQLKAGIKSKSVDRLRDAYNTLANSNRQLHGKPVWNKKFPVYDARGERDFGWSEWSGADLYKKITTEVSAGNKHDLVWGFIPGFQLMDFLVHITGANPAFSYAFAGFLLALLVRTTIFKLSTKQIMAARRSSQLLPLITEIKKEFPNDQMKQQERMMALYKEYGINPFAAFWPAFVQMPLFYAIYQCMVHYQFEFEKGTFLWINPATSAQTHGFVAPNLGQQDTILVFVYAITMIISQFLQPISVTDPTQIRQQRMIGIGITVMFTAFMFSGAFPIVSGFVLYWIFTNILATAQSLVLYRRPLPPLEKVNTTHGGVYPQNRWGKFMEQMAAAQEEELRKRNGGGGGSSNGKPSNSGSTFVGTGETKTGTPAKHKPKKRK